MQFRFLLSVSLSCLLHFAIPTEALAQVRQMTVITPVQVHVIDQIRDRNHEENQPQRQHSKLEQASESKTSAVDISLELPLRRGLSNNNPGFFTIAAFVDHDEVFPDSLLDWNCGERTYDADNFNHNGTDYNGAQFPWLTMANDGLVVIAAADGEIVEIHDGEPDKNCSFDSSAEANRVILEHDDGSITIYAHMKAGSVTPRRVGDRVEQGDYLGVMGSSGISTGPHLHLEVQDIFNNRYDPYAGSCNTLNSDSLWTDQESYHEKKILSLDTHSAQPEYPPCPQPEVPHFSNVFGPEDAVFLSVTVRDFEGTDEIRVELRDPSNATVFSTSYSDSTLDFAAAYSVVWGLQSSEPMQEGKYSWRATYNGQTVEHNFYVGAGPAVPATKPANNAFTGLWYDPALDGEGFNIVTAAGGTIVYFYGSDSRGNRVWLISDPIPGVIEIGKPMETLMFESTGGIFSSPVQSSRGLSAWGTLALMFSSCESGQSSLNGADGAKLSQITKLAGVSGASCVGGDVPADSGWAGLWFDPVKDGEGYNLIVAPAGRILYYYGFKSNGLRLWLISGVITETLDIGKTVEATMFEATQGTFSTPVPSGESLITWGTAKITVLDCNTVTIVVDGKDGVKTSNTVRLAGITGLSCSD